MGYKKGDSPWNSLNGKLEAIKRRALDCPIYVPAENEQVQLNYLNTNTIFGLPPKEVDYPLKKQKLADWKPPFVDEITL
jgi:hypothetical protein